MNWSVVDENVEVKYGTREHAELISRGRHCGVRDGLQWLTYVHLPLELQVYSAPFYVVAVNIISNISTDSPELTTAINKLIEAKDSAVRAGIKHVYGRAGSVSRPASVIMPPMLDDDIDDASDVDSDIE